MCAREKFYNKKVSVKSVDYSVFKLLGENLYCDTYLVQQMPLMMLGFIHEGKSSFFTGFLICILTDWKQSH